MPPSTTEPDTRSPVVSFPRALRDSRPLQADEPGGLPLSRALRDSRLLQADEPGGHSIRADRPAERPHLRLTRRGRIVLVVFAVLVASLLWFAAAAAAQASDHSAPAHPARQGMSEIVVQPGQTLWSIADQANPAADTRLVIQRIVTANSLTSENITAGQRLWVPAR